MGKFSKYGGKVSFKIDGEDIELKRDKTEKLQKLQDIMNQKEGLFKSLVDFFIDVMKRNYPEEPDEELEAFVQSNASTFLEEYQIAYNIISREDLKKAKEKERKKILGENGE